MATIFSKNNNNTIKFNKKSLTNNITEITNNVSNKISIGVNELKSDIQSVTEKISINEFFQETKETVGGLKIKVDSLVKKFTDENVLEETGAKIVEDFKNIKKGISDGIDSFLGRLAYGKVKEETIPHIGKIEYDTIEKDENNKTVYYLKGEQVAVIWAGHIIDGNEKIIYMNDGSYMEYESFTYEANDEFGNLVGTKYNPDGSKEIYQAIDNTKSDIYKKLYDLNGNIICFNKEGETLGTYDKNGNIIEKGTCEFYTLTDASTYPNSTFDYNSCTFKIEESVDGVCDYYTISGDGSYTYHNNDGSYYEINYGNMGQSGFNAYLEDGYYSDEQMISGENRLTANGIDCKKIVNYNSNGEISNIKIYNVRTKEVYK